MVTVNGFERNSLGLWVGAGLNTWNSFFSLTWDLIVCVDLHFIMQFTLH